VPKGTEKLNKDALQAGMQAAKRLLKRGTGATFSEWENEDL
jgi:hypothetical protein